MCKTYRYFCIPYDLAPKVQPPPYTVWFASWSTKPPILEPGMASPIVVCATDGELPAGATALGDVTKDPPPPPPLLATTNMTDYQAMVTHWLELTRDADE
jgi:hypothetical protein